MDEFNIKSVVDMIGESVYKLNGKTLLWTGTNGFLGEWVLRTIEYINLNKLKKPCRLLAYDMRLPELELIKKYSKAGIIFHSHDLTKKLWPVSEKIDYVVHMAGIASPFHYKQRPLETIDVALEGSRSSLEIARNHGARYLFTSSSEVYQTANIIPTPETYIGAIASNNDRSCYDVSKLMGENLSFVYSKNLGVNTGIVRIFNSFGPGITEGDSRILPRIASAIVGNHPISVFNNRILPKRTYCPAGNTVAGIFLALLNGTPSEIYNIGENKPEITVIELLELIQHVSGKKVPYILVEPTPVYMDEPLRRCPDISKAKRDLGYLPQITLEEGLVIFFNWALKRYTGVKNN